MNIIEYQYRKVPEYYQSMYQDGFTPDEILYALKRQMIREYNARRTQQNPSIKIESEIKIK